MCGERLAWVGALIVVLTLPGMCTAQDLAAEAEANFDKFCITRATGARALMEYRQSGGSAASMLQRFQGLRNDSAANHDLYPEYEKLLADAFAVPRYSTDEMKAQAISEFENSAFLACRQDHRASFLGH